MNTVTAPKARILTEKPASEHSPVSATPAWQIALQQAITDPAELLRELCLGEEWLAGARKAGQLFPLRVPRSYVQRMKPGDPHDPLLRQVLPILEETRLTQGFVSDAVGDLISSRGAGLLHKYHGRALLITTGACAINCRFCFRREFPYQENMAARDDWAGSIATLKQDTSIREVILSGGDPLSLSDKKLSALVSKLEGIPHLERLRIHTRQPIVLPERVDKHLLTWLSTGRLQKIVVLHVNHAQELDSQTSEAIFALASTGAVLLNQAVLLKGINDSVNALEALCESLFKLNVIPYYLHLLDRVKGTAHFEVNENQATELMRQLATRLPGYMVPKLVREEVGKANKTNVVW